MTILDRWRNFRRPPDDVAGPSSEPRMTSDLLQAGGGRFPTMTHNAARVNAYKPLVTPVAFPSVRLPFNPNIPPSINPQLIIRQGPTPMPSGRTVPPGAVRRTIGIIAPPKRLEGKR